jgi:acyl-CoA thioesterase-1
MQFKAMPDCSLLNHSRAIRELRIENRNARARQQTTSASRPSTQFIHTALMPNKLFKMFFIVLFSFMLVACKDAPTHQALPAGATVLAFGDSVTYGTGGGQGADYPAQLAQRSGWNVINAGRPGDTALAAKSRIDTLLQETTPALVIVELGGNDFLRRRAEIEVKEDLRAILQSIKTSGAIPVLVAVPQFAIVLVGSLSDSVIYSELAREENVVLVEDVFSEVLSDASLRADRIHPNAEGYRVLADGIAKRLSKAGLQAAE